MLEKEETGERLNLSFEWNEKRFRKFTTNLQRVDFFLNEHKLFDFPFQRENFIKDDMQAIETKEQGNKCFKFKRYTDALEKYTSSLALAKSKKIECALFYFRSSVLERLKLYKESLEDVDRALQGCTEELKDLLLKKREEIAKKAPVNNVNTVETSLCPQNDSVKIQSSEKFGRHIVAARDLEIGDLIVVEKPLIALLRNDFFLYCHECCSLCYNLIPCDGCSKTLYCSKLCKNKAYNNYHKYECGNLEHLVSTTILARQLGIALRLTLHLMRLKKSENDSELEKIKKMCTHEKQRSPQDIYIFCCITSVFFTALNENSALFQDFPHFENFFKENLLFSILAVDINTIVLDRFEPCTPTAYRAMMFALGFYTLQSTFNHSCVPNCFYYTQGTTLYIRALSTIKQGEQCFISYEWNYVEFTRNERQKYLSSKYYFKCLCPACKKDWQPIQKQALTEPEVLVQKSIYEEDRITLDILGSAFVEELKKAEGTSSLRAKATVRQLIIDCFQMYSCPRAICSV